MNPASRNLFWARSKEVPGMPERTTESAIVRLHNPLYARPETDRHALAAEQAHRTPTWPADWDTALAADIAAESEKAIRRGSVARPEAATARYDARRGLAR